MKDGRRVYKTYYGNGTVIGKGRFKVPQTDIHYDVSLYQKKKVLAFFFHLNNQFIYSIINNLFGSIIKLAINF